jgi:hypothetical protein
VGKGNYWWSDLQTVLGPKAQHKILSRDRKEIKVSAQTRASITVNFAGTSLVGYFMTNNTYQFIMHSKVHYFDTLEAAMEYWLETN